MSEYEETQSITYRGDNAGEVFIKKMETLSEELFWKIRNTDCKMIFIAEDNVKFKKATHCHICDEALPLGSTKIDHLENIGKWLRIMGLKKCMPKYKEVEKKKNNFKFIREKDFNTAKAELLEYLKQHNITVVRDYCHFTGKFREAAHQHCNLMYRKQTKIPAFFHNFTG